MEGGSFQGHFTGAMSATGVWRDRNASYFAFIILPGVGNTVYRGVEQIVTGAWMKLIEVIN